MTSVTPYRGILLSGGSGTRLHPLTQTVSKQLLPVYDKPMIYYPLTTLMLAGIRSILIITGPQDQELYRNLLRDGSQWGIDISYAVQEEPKGIAQALLIGEVFSQGQPVALMLGDNILYAAGLSETLQDAAKPADGATIFGYRVRNPSRYGVVKLDSGGNPIELVEKPDQPISPWAIPGLYFYDGEAASIAHSIEPSARNELEITDVNREYLRRDRLKVELLPRGTAWLDMGTHDSLLDAANFVKVIEERQGLKIACPEEVAYAKGFIGLEELEAAANMYRGSAYGDYLIGLVHRTPQQTGRGVE